MADLRDILRDNNIPAKRTIHDCVDTGSDLAILQNVEIQFPCDCANRNYINDKALWVNATGNFKDTIDDSLISVKIRVTLRGVKDSICTVKLVTPHPTLGDLLITEHDFVLYKNNIDINFEWTTFVYNGTDSDAKTYGFNVTLTPDANMTLKDRSILVMV